MVTPRKLNIAAEKWCLEDYFPTKKVTFQGRAVKLREGSKSCNESCCTTPYKLHNIWGFPRMVVPQKWMVKIMENPIKMDDLGGKTTIFGNIHLETLLQKNAPMAGRRKHIGMPLTTERRTFRSKQAALIAPMGTHLSFIK